MMYFFRTFSLLLLLFGTNLPPATAQGFIDDLGDVPLMQGMEIHHSTLVQFEAASGRVVEIQAKFTSWEQTRTFYRETLPSLGWQQNTSEQEMRFVRAGEMLSLVRAQQPQIMTFRLEPKN